MAMQTGIGLSRIVLIAGAGYTGTILLKNGKLSDILGELQNLVKQGESDGDSDYSDAIATQDGKLLSLEEKQEIASAGVIYLCGIVNGKKLTMPKQFQDQLQISGNSTPSLMGLKGIVDSPRNLLTDGNAQDSLNKSLSRTVSNKC